MSMVRYLLASNFGFTWNDIKMMPAHIVRQYMLDIERAKSHFKGLRVNDVKQYADSARAAGFSIT